MRERWGKGESEKRETGGVEKQRKKKEREIEANYTTILKTFGERGEGKKGEGRDGLLCKKRERRKEERERSQLCHNTKVLLKGRHHERHI